LIGGGGFDTIEPIVMPICQIVTEKEVYESALTLAVVTAIASDSISEGEVVGRGKRIYIEVPTTKAQNSTNREPQVKTLRGYMRIKYSNEKEKDTTFTVTTTYIVKPKRK